MNSGEEKLNPSNSSFSDINISGDDELQSHSGYLNKILANQENINEGEVEAPDEGDTCFSFRTLWAYTGPGWLMSIAYLDPGNLESDLQAGAYAGYQLIWVLFAATAMGLLLQILAARLGVVTGKHLAQVCRQEYSPRVSNALWVMTELAIIGSDIQEVIGSAIAFKILLGIPLWAGALITGFDTFTFLALHYFGVRKLEAFFAVLIFTMLVCFFIDFGYVDPSGEAIMEGFLPYVKSYAVVQAVSIIGAVIMPHNIYLHSALVQSRKVDRSSIPKIQEANKYFAIEGAVALAVAFLINLAVLAVFAAGFYKEECAEDGKAWRDGKCEEVGLLEAGDALKELLHEKASTIWAIGLLAAGQSSTMTGTYAGQFVMEGFLKLELSPWKRVAFTRGLALGPAIIVAISSETHKHAGDTLDEWLNILQSVQLPFALLPVIYFTNQEHLMGPFKNGKLMRVICSSITVMVVIVNIYLITTFVVDEDQPVPHEGWFYALVMLLGVIYLWFIGYLAKPEFEDFIWYIRNKCFDHERPFDVGNSRKGRGSDAGIQWGLDNNSNNNNNNSNSNIQNSVPYDELDDEQL